MGIWGLILGLVGYLVLVALIVVFVMVVLHFWGVED